jgi:hypothetical protein
MHADAMPHGELVVMPVEHRHQPLFVIVPLVDSDQLQNAAAAVDAGDDELGWKMWSFPWAEAPPGR